MQRSIHTAWKCFTDSATVRTTVPLKRWIDMDRLEHSYRPSTNGVSGHNTPGTKRPRRNTNKIKRPVIGCLSISLHVVPEIKWLLGRRILAVRSRMKHSTYLSLFTLCSWGVCTEVCVGVYWTGKNTSLATSRKEEHTLNYKLNKATVDIRLRPRYDAAPWWVSLSIRHGDKSTLLPIESLLRRIFLATACRHKVIHKTGST